MIRRVDMVQATTVDSSTLVEFEVDYENSKHLLIGEAVHSNAFSAGGHRWRLNCYPRGDKVVDKGEYLSLFLELLDKSSSVEAIFKTYLEGNGQPSSTTSNRTIITAHTFGAKQGLDWGWSRFISQVDLEANHIREGHLRFLSTISILNDSSIPVPPSDIGKHIGTLLDSTDGKDVSFTIDGETVRAHRLVLAARSPVFRALLCGSMAEATMSSITLHEITPATFRLMLQFMYTDALPRDDELGSSPTEALQYLLAAADWYALDRLKLLCAQKLWDNVSVDTVATTLACAEMYSCSELKNKCMDFFAEKKIFKEAVLTEGFLKLVQQFPSIIVELQERFGT